MLYNKGSLSGLLKPGFSKCAFLYAWTLWECCPPTLNNVMKTALWRVCRPLSQSSEKPVSCQSTPPVRRASSLASPELMMHVDTHEPSVWSHTLQVPQHRLEIHFWERLCPAAPYSAPFLNLALQAIKSPTGNGISSKRPRGFHYHYPSNQIFGQTA